MSNWRKTGTERVRQEIGGMRVGAGRRKKRRMFYSLDIIYNIIKYLASSVIIIIIDVII